jgi:hypothetical protein
MKTTTLFGRPSGSKIQTRSAPFPNGPWRPTRGGEEVEDAEPQPAARSARSASSATAIRFAPAAAQLLGVSTATALQRPARPARFSDSTIELLPPLFRQPWLEKLGRTCLKLKTRPVRIG